MGMAIAIRVMNTFTQFCGDGDSAPHEVFNAIALHLPEFAAVSLERRRQRRVEIARSFDKPRRSHVRTAKKAGRQQLESTPREQVPKVAACGPQVHDHRILLKRKASGTGLSDDGKRSIFRLRKRPVPKLSAVVGGKSDSDSGKA